jgi:phosphatidate cytidylyltransferase
MCMSLDPALIRGFGAVFALLCVASGVGAVLSRRVAGSATVANLRTRVRAWWVIVIILAVAFSCGVVGSLTLFALLSVLALREYFTLVPTRRGDHRALFWMFFLFTPLQYVLIGLGWYGLFSILIPVWVFLFVPARIAMAGDTSGFLERTAKVQWGLMIFVYSLSHAPALLMLKIPGFHENARLLFFLLVVDQMSDVLQYVWGKLVGRRRIAPTVSPNKTWEGAVGGILSAAALGMAMYRLTPFTPAAAGAISLAIGVAGFAGGLTMSAIKRDSGAKDFGSIVPGHGGVIDRLDSLCFAAPVFFHLVRYFYVR